MNHVLKRKLAHINSLMSKQAHQEAHQNLQVLLYQYPTQIDIRFLAAKLTSLDGDYAQALSHLTIALKYDPQNLVFNATYLWNLCLLKRFDEVISYVQAYHLTLHADDEILFLYAYALEVNGDYQQATQYYHQCLQVNAEHQKCLFAYGQLSFNLKQYKESKSLLHRLCTLNKTSSEYWYLYAKALIACGDEKKGIKLFNKALRIRHDYTWIHYDLAHLYKKLGLLNKAIKHYQYSLSYQPIQYRAYYHLARISIQQSKPLQAIEYFEKYLPYAKKTNEINHLISQLQIS